MWSFTYLEKYHRCYLIVVKYLFFDILDWLIITFWDFIVVKKKN